MISRFFKLSHKHFYLPPLGQRIVKTAVAVFLCLVFYRLRGYRGETMSAEAAITAIICMQPYVEDTKEYSLNRLAGTLIGAMWGFLFLLIMPIFPALGQNPFTLYPLMGLGVLISLYSAVAIRKPDTSSLAAIVFVCVVIAYPDIEHPLDQAFHRVLDVLVGTAIAVGVNIFRLPRVKQRNKVFFVRTKDLASDQLSQIPSAVLFRLNYLYNDGAKVCLMSEHAPAFFMSQMNLTGIFFPFSMEANYNNDCYKAKLPCTVCHELAHTRGYILEDEATFLAVLACIRSDDPYYKYAGYMTALSYTRNQIFEYADDDTKARIDGSICDEVWADIDANREYWDSVKEKEDTVLDTETVSNISSEFVDNNLKMNGVEDGSKSYGRMVDLMLNYFIDKKQATGG